MSDENIIQWSKDNPLTWDDFQAPIGNDPDTMAKTFSALKCEWNEDMIDTDSSYKFKIIIMEISAIFDRNQSWEKDIIFSYSPEDVKYLLKHEQGHFDLAEECARKLNRKITKLSKKEYLCKGKTPNERRKNAHVKSNEIVKPIFDEEYAKLEQLQSQYDKQTDHGKIRNEQSKWDVRFAKMCN